MDLSTYYNEFQLTYNLSIVALCLASFAVIFVGVRSIRDKTESVRTKVVNCLLLLLIFFAVLTYFLLGPNLAKKDIDQKTIYCYDGSFEIVETSNGIYKKATFLFDGQELVLKYPREKNEFDVIQPGTYDGKIVYAQHLAQVLYFEIEE